MLTLLVLFLIVFAVAGGGLGYRRYGIGGGIGPIGIVLVVLVILYFTGNMHGMAT